jgi:hypothetical protein
MTAGNCAPYNHEKRQPKCETSIISLAVKWILQKISGMILPDFGAVSLQQNVGWDLKGQKSNLFPETYQHVCPHYATWN